MSVGQGWQDDRGRVLIVLGPPSDEIEGIDVEHASRTVQAAIDAVLVLADGERPAWHPGGRPEPPTERAPAR